VAKSYPCPFCEQVYTNEAALADHTNAQHTEPDPICPLCQVPISDGDFKSHIEREHTHTPEAMVLTSPAAFCQQGVPPQQQQQPKKRKWPQEKAHQCVLCPYESNRAERLRVHIQGVHNNERAYACSLCDKCFKQRDKLSRHINSVHLQQKPFWYVVIYHTCGVFLRGKRTKRGI
jgi:uncharacterized C2H2 Zn-finger protein